MRNAVIVTIDGLGNLQVDFSGYTGNACTYEEVELRSLLAELGLNVEPRNRRSKNRSDSATTTVRSQAKQKVNT